MTKKTKLTLWAVVIGKKGQHNRHIATDGAFDLAVYDTKKEAEEGKEEVFDYCNHKDVFVKKFIEA